ncbi:MAG: ATP-binding protein [Planctomycetia bacterium]
MSRSEDRLTALLEAGVELARAQDLEALQRRLLDLATQHVDAERGTLWLVDPAHGTLTSVVQDGEGLAPLVLMPERGIAGRVAATGQAARLEDAYADPDFDRTTDQRTGFRTRSMLAVPVALRGAPPLGVVQVLNNRSGAFDADDEAFLLALASFSAVALEHRLRLEQERLATIGRVAASLVHDLGAPLTAVHGYADMLEQDVPAEVRARCAAGIRRQATRLSGMVRAILGFARGDQPLLRARVDVDRLLDELAEDLAVAYAGGGVRVERLPGSAGHVLADEGALRRALENLARNAAQAMPQGGTLALGATLEGEAVRLVVRDSGLGMDAATRARIFEPFFTRGRHGGTGLGLSIVEHVVTSHGGRIEVHSQPGAGTTFVLHLPLAP